MIIDFNTPYLPISNVIISKKYFTLSYLAGVYFESLLYLYTQPSAYFSIWVEPTLANISDLFNFLYFHILGYDTWE